MYGSSGPDGWPYTPRRTWTKRRVRARSSAVAQTHRRTPDRGLPGTSSHPQRGTVRYRQERKLLAVEGLRNVLRTHRPPTVRTLEQKISDSGPFDQRIDPHVMTSVRKALENIGDIHDLSLSGGECLELQGAQH